MLEPAFFDRDVLEVARDLIGVTLLGDGIGQCGCELVEGKQVPRVIVAKGVKLDSAASVTAVETASADPATVFANRSAYETYLPLYGNVSHATRTTFFTKAIDPPGH